MTNEPFMAAYTHLRYIAQNTETKGRYVTNSEEMRGGLHQEDNNYIR